MPYLYSSEPRVVSIFRASFPRTRESYGEVSEDYIARALNRAETWVRIGKPHYRQDLETGITYRKSHVNGRITVCVPYAMAFQIAVRRSCMKMFACMAKPWGCRRRWSISFHTIVRAHKSISWTAPSRLVTRELTVNI